MIPHICAKMHCDKHMKLLIEAAQMLSTAHRVLDGKLEIKLTKNNRKIKRYILYNDLENVLYKSTHVNHPCTVWARKSKLNYIWLYELFCCLCDEYKSRYKRTHLTDTKLRKTLKKLPENLKGDRFTKFPQAMPEQYQHENVTVAYNNFYKTKTFAKWKDGKKFKERLYVE